MARRRGHHALHVSTRTHAGTVSERERENKNERETANSSRLMGTRLAVLKYKRYSKVESLPVWNRSAMVAAGTRGARRQQQRARRQKHTGSATQAHMH